MYAVIASGGKQYRVGLGDVIRVEKLPVTAGESVELDRVLLIGGDDNEVRVGNPVLSESVTATVRGHGRGDKVRIFKLRRRKNSRQQAGHRQDYTELEITAIAGLAPGQKPAAKKAAAKKAPKRRTKKLSPTKAKPKAKAAADEG